ncbi:MAG TPA: hypothetical protein ENH91_07150 [Leeuwenhoekiella sp.]|nr:hypothetical protein [Leeuwenhoekiella sp.]
MKATILSFVFPLLFLACSSDDDASRQYSENTFTAVKNEKSWNGITEIGLTTEDTLVFLGVADGGADNGVVVAKVKFEGKGHYDLIENQGIYYETVGGDAMVRQYAIEKGKIGSFNIISYDSESQRIKGEFEMPLKAMYLNQTNVTDSTLTIVNGLFSGTIREEVIY